jgi:hypothetical protein
MILSLVGLFAVNVPAASGKLMSSRPKSPDQSIDAVPLAIVCTEIRHIAERQIHDDLLGRQFRYDLRTKSPWGIPSSRPACQRPIGRRPSLRGPLH